MNPNEQPNIAATLAKEMARPVELGSEPAGNLKRVALPPGWKLETCDDDSRLLDSPRRKIAKSRLNTTESFIQYAGMHRNSNTTLWCIADYPKAKLSFTAIIDDFGVLADDTSWREHLAIYVPELSAEWKTFSDNNRKAMTQAEFAVFIEDNLSEIVSSEGKPSGAQMLEMALNFEAKQEMKFKSSIRLASGGVQFNYIEDDDAQTLSKMTVFNEFSLGLPVFWGGDKYQLNARMRYRCLQGNLTFWYELIRPEKVMEAATVTVIDQIKAAVPAPLFFGDPFNR